LQDILSEFLVAIADVSAIHAAENVNLPRWC
jgi:hypothetical protein